MLRIFLIMLIIIALAAFSNIDWDISEEPGETEENRDPEVTAEEVVSHDGLHPVVEDGKEELLQRAEDKDISLVITEGYRSSERQDELYAQGRTNGGDVVTNAAGGESYHNYGLALDYAVENNEGELVWDVEADFSGSGESDWREVADIAKDIGFEWGGDWANFRDYPHLQMTFGISIQELQRAEEEQNND